MSNHKPDCATNMRGPFPGPCTCSAPVSGAVERRCHPEGRGFEIFFTDVLMKRTQSCWQRDVIRSCKETLWAAWKERAGK